MFWTTKRGDFASIEGLTAREWLEGGCGKARCYMLWKLLMELKSYVFADEILASWSATRVKRVGKSRRRIFQEDLGYIDDRTETLVKALVNAFEARGARFHLTEPVEKIEISDGCVVGVSARSGFFAADATISTVPTPLVSRLAPSLPADGRTGYDAIRNVGVACLTFKIKRSMLRNFWLNIIDPEIEVPSLIEFSNLRLMPDTIVYVPYYMPTTPPKWIWTNQQFINEVFGYVRRVNSAIQSGNRRCGRSPSSQAPIAGLQISDTRIYYPKGRGVAKRIRYGRMMKEAIK
ncbi:FAD-dependent oxidoreductase [Bradyrhizobium japonicum]|uniref:FAD-dependent oxidoreductase n=1 Tax=Bradyrhizobium japonicum TaxID=375 RepID=UPI0004BAAF48|nr:FAD-dependent oxidoreductase [Bradyrhizobium japonicum]